MQVLKSSSTVSAAYSLASASVTNLSIVIVRTFIINISIDTSKRKDQVQRHS